MSVGIDGGDRGPHRSGDTGRADGMRTEGAGRGRRAKRSAPNREDGPPDPARRRERTPQERGRLDLRLVVPALAAWLTAAVCLGVSPGAAGTAGVAVVVVAVGFGALAALRGRTERGCGRGGRAVPGRAVRGRTRGRCAVRGWVGLGVLSLGAAGLVLVSLGGQGALARTAPLVAAADRGETVRVELSVDQVPRRLGPSRFGGGERIAVEGTAREVAVAPQRPQTSPGVEGRTAGPRAARTGDITDDRGVADSDGPSHGGVGGQDAGRIGTGGEAVAANARRYIRLGGRPARMLAFVTLDTSTVTCAEADTCRAGDAGADDGVGPGDAVDLGDILILRGHAVPSEAADRERVVLPGASIESVRAPTGWRGMVSRLRRGLMGAAAAVPGDAGALIPGIAIGDVSTLSDDLDGAMKGSSLTHITAVSGAHVAIVLGAVLALASALRVPRVPRVALGGVALACFVALVGPGPSVLRSALMGAVTLLALGLGRTRGALGALGASVLVLLVVDPWIAREYGFALSVVATAALIVLA
ncbi:MAG: ComEC/Rec2 family competence protein, partial [Bifidobacteriaceae bacterium]|nr:ComEC/Rec2 family competence protein [Bifidobacteriaceae bacterium]